jgi:hypothetical protein
MRDYTELATYQRDGFEVVVDKTWEDLSLDQCFDTSIDPDSGKPYYDVRKMARQIDRCELDWFMLRVRVLLDGHEFGTHYLGGCLYEDAREVLTDGTAEDCIYCALEEAKTEVLRLRNKLETLVF